MIVRREIYSKYVELLGFSAPQSLSAAHALALDLVNMATLANASQAEAKSFLRETMPRATRELGPHDTMTLKFRWVYAYALTNDENPTLDDMIEAEATLVEIEKIFTRRFGPEHPETAGLHRELATLRKRLAVYTRLGASDMEEVRSKLASM